MSKLAASTTDKTPDSFLVRLRKHDTPTAVSALTIKMLMEQTGLTQTEVTHLALRQFADRFLPRYEHDNGPLTPEQRDAIRAASPATAIPPERFTETLF